MIDSLGFFNNFYVGFHEFLLMILGLKGGWYVFEWFDINFLFSKKGKTFMVTISPVWLNHLRVYNINGYV